MSEFLGESRIVCGLVISCTNAPGLENAAGTFFQPGRHPLQALSTGLARVATGDPAPAAKADRAKRTQHQEFRDSKHCRCKIVALRLDGVAF